jgi:hypothetical protein
VEEETTEDESEEVALVLAMEVGRRIEESGAEDASLMEVIAEG